MKRTVLLLGILAAVFMLSFGVCADASGAYGVLIGAQDFEGANALNAKLSDPGSGIYNFGSNASVSVTTPAVSGASSMLCVASDKQTAPTAGYTNMTITAPGVYTLVFDYFIPADYTLGWFRVGHNLPFDDIDIAAVKGSLQHAAVSLELHEGETLKQLFFRIYNYGTPITNSFCIDNVALYYLAEEGEYGRLQGLQDFEGTAPLDQKLIEPGSALYTFGTGAALSVEKPDAGGATKMLRVKSDGQTAPGAGFTNMSLARAGTYTVCFDCYMPTDYVYGWFRLCTNMDDYDIPVTKGSLCHFAMPIEVQEGEKLTQFFFKTYYWGTAINNSFYIDNIQLYFKPYSFLFEDDVTDLVTSFIGDAKTTRGFAWRSVKSHADMAVRYAESEEDLAENGTVVNAKSELYERMLYYKADVTGLMAGTTYFYQIGDTEDDIWSKVYSFTTEEEDTDAFDFLVFADPQCANENVTDIFRQNLEKSDENCPDPAFYVSLGDLVNLGTDEDLWNYYFTTFGERIASTPHMAVMGNHEARAGEAGKNFRLHFNHPDNGHGALENLTESDVAETYTKEVIRNIADTVYSFDYGNAHFAVLNTGSDWSTKTDGIALAAAQKSWLINDLQSSDAAWKIVMLHIGVYGASSYSDYGLKELFEPVFAEYGVDVVLEGHDHIVARSYAMKNGIVMSADCPDVIPKGLGTTYLVAGGASSLRGGNPGFKEDYLANLTETAGSNPTHTVVHVSADALTVTTYALNGDTVDEFTIVAPPARSLAVTVSDGGYDVAYIPSEEESGAALFFAFYDTDGRLIGTAAKEVSGQQSIGFTMPLETTVSRVGVFAFGDTAGLQPVTEALFAVPKES